VNCLATFSLDATMDGIDRGQPRHPRDAGGTRGEGLEEPVRRARAVGTPGTAGVRGDRHDGEGAAPALAADRVVRVRGAEEARVVGARLVAGGRRAAGSVWFLLATLHTLDCRVNGITFPSKKSIYRRNCT
jgi:hypothetical protein